MNKLEIARPEVARAAINREISRSEESRYDHRLHGLLLVIGGQSCQQVAELLGEDRRTVQRWVKSYETKGLDGLREGERPGRPAPLNERQTKALKREISRSPQSFGHTPRIWSGKVLVEHLRLKYDVLLGLRQCQRILSQIPPSHRGGYGPGPRRGNQQ